MIEYTHRLTSGVLGILGLLLVGWSAVRLGRHRVTLAAAVTVVFIVFEALIGAGLVLRELVANDDSVARALVIGLHLVNTLMLMGAATLTAWWTWDDRSVSLRALGSGGLILGFGLLAIMLTSMSGAVTALGDTLFPVDPASGDLFARVRGDLSPAKHFLVRLRILHPVIAVFTAGSLMWIAAWVRQRSIDPVTPRLARGLQHVVVVEVFLGVLNIGMAAPGWMQLLHLLTAQMVWIAAVLTTASACSRSTVPQRAQGAYDGTRAESARPAR
jgi:heme A synthase